MKKLLFILALCLTVFASAQCPLVNLTQNAKWKFMFSQCFEDTTTHSYVLGNNIAYFDANKNLTYISYAALLDSLNIPGVDTSIIATKAYVNSEIDSLGAITGPSGNNHNIQFKENGLFSSSTDFNYNGNNGVFYIYDFNGDTLFSVNTQTREIKAFGTFNLKALPDSALLFLDANKNMVNDSNNLAWDGNTLYLLNKNNAVTSAGALVITGATASSLSRISHSMSNNNANIDAQYQWFRSAGTPTVPTAVINNLRLGTITWGGYTGTSWVAGSTSIRAVAGGTWLSANIMPSYLQFTTGDANAQSYVTVLTQKGTLAIKGTNADSVYDLTVHGTAMIESTPAGSTLTDTVLITDQTTKQVKAWKPVRLFALKGDTNTFGALTTGTIGSGAITSTGLVQGTAFLTSSPTNGFIISGAGRLKAPDGNGIWELTNNTENGFNRLNLGDNTASFPSIKRNGAGIDFVVADNSGPTFITATQAVLLDTVASGNITMGAATYYSFSGTTATWTLPTLAASNGFTYFIKNRGSGNLTINTNAGGNDIYDTATVNTITVSAGASVILHNDGTYFNTQ